MNRSRWLGGLRRVGLVAVLVSALGLSSCSAADSLSVDALIQLCEQAQGVAADELESMNETVILTDEMYPGEDEHMVDCVPSPRHLVDVDDSSVWVNLSIGFYLDRDIGFPEDDYCETEGVFNQPTNTSASESREFSGRPYCFSWGALGSGSSIVSSYAEHDHDAIIVVSWSVTEYLGSLYGEGDELAARVLAANDTVLALIHDGFESAGSADALEVAPT